MEPTVKYNYYTELGVRIYSSWNKCTPKWLDLMTKAELDKNPDDEMVRERIEYLNEMRDTISTPARKKIYDARIIHLYNLDAIFFSSIVDDPEERRKREEDRRKCLE